MVGGDEPIENQSFEPSNSDYFDSDETECTLLFQDTGMIEAVSKYGLLRGWIQQVASSSMKDIIDK